MHGQQNVKKTFKPR